jgi:hypothetical protein
MNPYIAAAHAAQQSKLLTSFCPSDLVAWAESKEEGCAQAEQLASPSMTLSTLPEEAERVSHLPPFSTPNGDSFSVSLRWACQVHSISPGIPPLPQGLRWRVASSHPRDIQSLHACVVELAEFENGLDEVTTTPETYLRDGFGAGRQFHALLLEGPREVWEGYNSLSSLKSHPLEEGVQPSHWESQGYIPLGCAIAHASYSTWQGRTVYLEDLYLSEAVRRKGAARRALSLLSAACIASGARRMQWCCLDWNTEAMKLYSGVGALKLDEWTLFRVERQGLSKVAATL